MQNISNEKLIDFTTMFASCDTVNEARDLYRKLSKEHHPDLGGDTDNMKLVNTAYESYTSRRCTTEERDTEAVVMAKIVEVLLMNLPEDCLVELVGSWIWVSGNTKEHREELKASGMRWSGTRKRWYWHDGKVGKRRTSNGSFEDVKLRHGARSFATSRGSVAA